jgi:hypothetical protein
MNLSNSPQLENARAGPCLSCTVFALCFSIAAFHSQPISFSDQMSLNLHFCFPCGEGLIPSLIAAINILIQGSLKR